MDFEIRLETKDDYSKVEEMTREAFWNLYVPGCDEHYLVNTMRSHPDFIQDLDYVAVKENQIVGSILYTKSHVVNENGDRRETATFGPLCVHPKYQRVGIGSALIEHTKRLVVEKGFPAIVILGDPHNYCKHGFKNGRDYNISTINGKFPLGLLVLELKEGAFANHSWKFKESEVYEIDREKVDEYDGRFAPKEKKRQYSQELFSMLIRSSLE